MPDHWQADADDVGDIARVGSSLLRSADAAQEGLESLASYVAAGAAVWVKRALRRLNLVGAPALLAPENTPLARHAD